MLKRFHLIFQTKVTLTLFDFVIRFFNGLISIENLFKCNEGETIRPYLESLKEAVKANAYALNALNFSKCLISQDIQSISQIIGSNRNLQILDISNNKLELQVTLLFFYHIKALSFISLKKCEFVDIFMTCQK